MKDLEYYRVSHYGFPVSGEGMDINDTLLKRYIASVNGGYYLDGALHLFGVSDVLHHSLQHINSLAKSLYGDLVNGWFFFGEDLFGNLYGIKAGVYLFNIDQGSFEFIANDFEVFVTTVINDDYFTGYALAQHTDVNKLCEGFRYCPKLPFVTGGAYAPENLVLKTSEENIRFSAYIYSQINDLPDGTEIRFEITG